jgi:hypothetical protein
MNNFTPSSWQPLYPIAAFSAYEPMPEPNDFSHRLGDVFLPNALLHVHCKSQVEQAALMLADRRHSHITCVHTRPGLTVTVGGRVLYGCWFDLHLLGRAPAVWVVTSERNQDHASNTQGYEDYLRDCAHYGFIFQVFSASDLIQSIELRNVLLTRPFALVEVSEPQVAAILNAFRVTDEVQFGELYRSVNLVAGATLRHLYGLMYRGFLEVDWETASISARTPVRLRPPPSHVSSFQQP